MANLHKIDPVFWDKVRAYCHKDQKFDCLVWCNPQKTPSIQKKVLHTFPFINAVGLSLNYDEVLKFSDQQEIRYISPVRKATIALNDVRKIVDTNTLLRSKVRGKNVNVAVIDTGCNPHLDLVLGRNRIVKFEDFVNGKTKPYDDNGHGTFVCGVIGGNGLCSNAKFCGMAPECKLVVLKALNSEGETQVFTILNAMQWIVDHKDEFNIRVVCMSFGSEPLEQNDPLVIGAEVLWDNGIVVVCASGNDGANAETVKSPAISPKVLSVGACTRDGLGFKVADFSSFGVYNNIIRPDLVAPGVDVTSLNVGTPFYTAMSGTSVATPVVVGVVGLVLQKCPNLSPNKIKSLVLGSAEKHDSLPRVQAGAGIVNGANAISFLCD